MKFFKCLSFTISIFLFSAALRGQDKIYLANDLRQGQIVEISPTVIRYRSLYNTRQTLFLSAREALIIFNSKGDYLVPSKLDSTNQLSKDMIAQFLAADSLKNQKEKDQVFTNKKNKVDGNITNEDNNFVYLADAQKIEKNNIVAVVYKNGQQKIYGNIDSAVAVLWAVQSAGVKKGDPVTANVPIKQDTGSSHNSANDTSNAKTMSADDSARQRAFAAIAGDISRKEFEDRAVQKTNKLNEYLKILCSKSTSYEKSNEAIDQSVNLFVSENAIVETSSIKKNTVNHYKIRDYLTRVKLFKYDKIEIEWTHVQYVSDLKMGADGNFYGVVTFEQEFRGYRDNQLVYSDITRKNANVVLKTYNKSYEGTTKTIWDVLLSDIGVVYTKSSENN